MNGVHDMGGMDGMGSLQYEKDSPVFHARWEGRVFAMMQAMGAWHKFSNLRYQLERIPAPEYLRMSYYEKWYTALVELLLGSGLVSRAEVDSGKRARGSPKTIPPFTVEQAAARVGRRTPSAAAKDGAPATFKAGDRVRARNINPVAHTRLPRYARGKAGVIERDHGLSVLQDTQPLSLGRMPQHVYTVRFSARELWGEPESTLDFINIDLWDDYLEPV